MRFLSPKHYLTPEEIFSIVEEATEPKELEVRFKFYITSQQIAILIDASKLHIIKFQKKLKINGFSDEQKKVFRMLKVTDIIDIGE